MADRIQNIIRRLETSARFSDSEDEDEIPMANGVVNKRPRLSESTSEPQPQPDGQSRMPMHQLQTVQRSRPQSQGQASCLVGEGGRSIPLQEVESDSDAGSDAFDVEEDEEEFEADEEDFGSDDFEDVRRAHDAAEAHHLHQCHSHQHHGDDHHHHQHQHPQPQVSASAAASSQLGQVNPGGGFRSSSGLVAEFNNASGAIPVMLTDPDVLDCPICLEPLRTPIYQCENGHITCCSCCSRTQRKCPSCCLAIGFNRCRAMEKLIESVRVECKNTMFGCKEKLVYSKKAEHEQACPHTACFCPHPACTFASSFKNLYLHFSSQHAASATPFCFNTTFSITILRSHKFLLLQEKHLGVIFILNHDVQGHGRLLNVVCIGPSTLDNAFVYRLTVKCMETSLSLKSVPRVYAKWQQQAPQKNHLTVPSDFVGYSGRLSVQLSIKRARTLV